ncbi:cytosolic protein [Bifidobacterium dolichotidis]|uniref:Cytosolic protein n=1 Tax=Bifidobacterium dolichotidis TaxID=2306976 RepID=A0A430FQP7_9BIFI|nr:phasin family protein [Bifidobacterium dolichotidis]RSX55172.1 cytosolic protein [Bifidobacterium dolichotidis]
MAENNNLVDGLGEGLRKVFLAGVGALATTAEKGSEIINDLVKKGELTVSQGKELNEELSHKAGNVSENVKESVKEAGEQLRSAAAGIQHAATKKNDED